MEASTFRFKKKDIMKDLVKSIIEELVEHRDKVVVNSAQGSSTILIEVSVHQSDLPKIIGKSGAMVKAIRTILHAISSRKKIRINLEILECENRDVLL